jgi:uncharacterized Zn finger protein (UPF0148 family)
MTVIGYNCPVHGGIPHCEVDEIGERICPTCGRPVTARTGDPEAADE